MFTMLLSFVLAAPPTPSTPSLFPEARKIPLTIEGHWSVLAIEKNGEPVAGATDMKIHVKGDIITCTGKDDKTTMVWTIEFADHGIVRVKVTEGETTVPLERTGVYVLTKDYIAVCLHELPRTTDKTPAATDVPVAKSHSSILLKRMETEKK